MYGGLLKTASAAAILAAAGVLLGPAAFLYWPWLLLRLAEERSSVE